MAAAPTRKTLQAISAEWNPPVSALAPLAWAAIRWLVRLVAIAFRIASCDSHAGSSAAPLTGMTGASPLVGALNLTVDLRTLQSDSSRRDSYIQQNTLQTDTYPNATFVSVSTQGLPASYTDGQTVHFQLAGNLTMHGKTNKEVFDVQGKVVGKTITGTATSTIYMTDFGIQPPNLANIAIAQNKVLITITFTAKAA